MARVERSRAVVGHCIARAEACETTSRDSEPVEGPVETPEAAADFHRRGVVL
jgi:hypothetical protein